MRGTTGTALFSTALAALLSGCGSNTSPRVNLPPTAELTSGPVEGDTVSYHVSISWTGSDPDGVVDRFEFAIDPPAAFSEEEIAQGGPGIASVLVPGTGGAPDTTRVSKAGGVGVVSFDWIHTREKSRLFTFSTPDAESTGVAGDKLTPTGRFNGMHALYVRAVDDDGAVSVPDKVAYTAQTVAPVSRITRPNIQERGLLAHPGMIIEWNGRDPDGLSRGKSPVGYIWSLVHIEHPIITEFTPPPEFFLRDAQWVFQSADTLTLTPSFPTVPGAYVFGLRAMDENDAVEPFLDWGRNAFRFGVRAGESHPLLVVNVNGQTFTARGSGTGELEIPAGLKLKTHISCTAEEYGETCNEVRWGVDLADVESTEGWGPWTTSPQDLPPLVFDPAGLHVLYVQARDSLDNTSLLSVVLQVVEFPFDREVLFVDDSFDTTYPRPEEHDDFWRMLSQDYADHSDWEVSDFYEIHTFGSNPPDHENFDPAPLSLAELGRYKLIIWESLGSGINGITSLLKTASLRPTLGTYLQAGGKLWLGGRLTIGATVPSENGINANLEYPKEWIRAGQFPYDFLKLHTTKIDNDKGNRWQHTLARCKPFPGRPAIYDTLSYDPSKFSPITLGDRRVMANGDAVASPIFAESEPGFRGDIDSLYVYGAAGPELYGTGSVYQGRLNAIRWHDPDPDRVQGRIQWFGFSLYFFRDDQAREVFKRSLDWFREESPPMSGGGVDQ